MFDQQVSLNDNWMTVAGCSFQSPQPESAPPLEPRYPEPSVGLRGYGVTMLQFGGSKFEVRGSTFLSRGPQKFNRVIGATQALELRTLYAIDTTSSFGVSQEFVAPTFYIEVNYTLIKLFLMIMQPGFISIFYKRRLPLLFVLFIANVTSTIAQDQKHLPIVDVHVHAMKVNPAFSNDMCPWFLKNMPGADPSGPPPSFLNTDCADPLKAAKTDQEMQDAVIGTLKRLNMTFIAYGDPQILRKWQKAAPGRIIPGIGISSPKDMTVKALQDSLSSGFYKVMGEVAPQYQGLPVNDMSLDEYFAVAEKLNIPVGIHMGTGGNGMANITSPKYRASLGNPFLLEDVLAKHPKLKIWVMHAGYPMINEIIALMGANAYVYVDLAGFIWSYPQEEIHDYLKRLVQAGFGKRIMYGTDLLVWPKLIETSVGLIENANYLSFEQKRDIFFNNAVRFFRLDESKFK